MSIEQGKNNPSRKKYNLERYGTWETEIRGVLLKNHIDIGSVLESPESCVENTSGKLRKRDIVTNVKFTSIGVCIIQTFGPQSVILHLTKDNLPRNRWGEVSQ